MDFIDFLRFYKLTHCFIGFDTNHNALVSEPEMKAKGAKCNPYMPLSKKEEENLKDACVVASTSLIGLNLKEFVAFFNYKKIFEKRIANGSTNLVDLESMVTGLEALGFTLPKFIADQIKQDGDPDLSSMFDYNVAFQKFELIKQGDGNRIACDFDSKGEEREEVSESISGIKIKFQTQIKSLNAEVKGLLLLSSLETAQEQNPPRKYAHCSSSFSFSTAIRNQSSFFRET